MRQQQDWSKMPIIGTETFVLGKISKRRKKLILFKLSSSYKLNNKKKDDDFVQDMRNL